MILLALIQAQRRRNEEDIRLLEAVVRRDQSAFAELYDRYASLVYTLVLRMVRSAEEAEDLLQEIFLQVWNKAGTFVEVKGSVFTWVITIARNKTIDRLRSKEQTRKGLPEEAAVRVPDEVYKANPLSATISAEYEALMKEGLAMLSAEQRVVLELSYFEGYTQVQISDRLDVPLGTVKTRMRQGLIKLRDYLKERIEK